ncbi:MAG: shikimate kinase [Synergistaceae bacterium]|nr:shikimate kinase [Synergistaceae bacterium]
MKSFGLLGEKLGHSFSPSIHWMLGSYSYELCEICPKDIENFLKDNSLDGFNVTIPYKQDVIPYCSELSERAYAIGSVNTMLKKPDGSYYGENTDYDGFLLMMEPVKENIRGKKVLILGSGGASKTVRAVLSDLGADPLITVSRSGSVNYENISEQSDTTMIVNTTPLGMYPNNGISPIDLSLFTECEFLADLIYNPAKTALMLQAERFGIPFRGGLLMLVEQARRASELFTGTYIPRETSYVIAEKIEKQTKNIVLIGMPGCGKTSIGRHLQDLTKRKFVDIDEEIESREGRTIPAIFADTGEAYFRKVESEVLREFCKESGLVISAGGGAVTTSENKDIMRQNSKVVFIKRELKDLDTSGRPVSKAKGTEQLYSERAGLYESWSDISVHNRDSLKAAKKITEVLKL